MRRWMVPMLGVVVALASGVAAATAGAGASAAAPINVVGTWTGPYQFPSGTDQVVSTTETLHIDRQTGELLWGRDEYTQNGQLVEIPVRGSLDLNGKGLALAESSGFFEGTVLSSGRMQLRFVRTDAQFTAFSVLLHRSK